MMVASGLFSAFEQTKQKNKTSKYLNIVARASLKSLYFKSTITQSTYCLVDSRKEPTRNEVILVPSSSSNIYQRQMDGWFW